MAQWDDEGWWEFEPTGVDAEGFEEGHYRLIGSRPLSVFEVMLFTAERVSGAIDFNMEFLR